MYTHVLNDNANQLLFNLCKVLSIAYQSSNEFLTTSCILQDLQDIIELNLDLIGFPFVMYCICNTLKCKHWR